LTGPGRARNARRVSLRLDESAALSERLLKEVGARRPLPRDEELRLARLVAEGKEAAARLGRADLSEEDRRRLEELVERGREAKSTLVAHNLQLVVRLARRFRWSGLSFLDLFQEGVLGLLRAAERFDWRRNVPFSTYAAWWVRSAMSRAVQEATSSVRLPDRLRSALRRLARERAREPVASWEALAERAEVGAEEAEWLIPLLGSPLHLEGSAGEGEAALADLLADREAEEALDEVLVAADVERVLRAADAVLSPRERRVLERRYGLGGREPRTLREVGEELGVTAQRVAQIEEQALRKLRGALGVVPADPGPGSRSPSHSAREVLRPSPPGDAGGPGPSGRAKLV
jgi:RNA polymerase primary sigma factor